MFSSMGDPVGGNIILIGVPFWAVMFFFLFWPFHWAVTEFWRVMRHRSIIRFWPIRFFFAILLFFAPIFLGMGLCFTFLF